MRRPLLSVIVLGAGLLSACTPRVQPGVSPPPVASAPMEEISISRGPCFGFCPVYKVSVTPAGRVDFTGERHTALLGPASRAAGRSAYDALRASLSDLRPATGSESTLACTQAATDMADVTIEWIAAEGRRTALTFNLGCRSPQVSAAAQTVEQQLGALGVAPWAAQKTRPGAPRG